MPQGYKDPCTEKVLELLFKLAGTVPSCTESWNELEITKWTVISSALISYCY